MARLMLKLRNLNSPLSFFIKGGMRGIILYQKYISPFIGKNCRFYPSCSQYTLQAFQHYGFLQGTIFALKRIMRCHPFHRGGYDPLPLKHRNLNSDAD